MKCLDVVCFSFVLAFFLLISNSSLYILVISTCLLCVESKYFLSGVFLPSLLCKLVINLFHKLKQKRLREVSVSCLYFTNKYHQIIGNYYTSISQVFNYLIYDIPQKDHHLLLEEFIVLLRR